VRYGDAGTAVGTQKSETNINRSKTQLLHGQIKTLQAANEELSKQVSEQPSRILLAEMTTKLGVAVRAVTDSKSALTRKTLSNKLLREELSRSKRTQQHSADGVHVARTVLTKVCSCSSC
jgi:hypothetical protein